MTTSIYDGTHLIGGFASIAALFEACYRLLPPVDSETLEKSSVYAPEGPMARLVDYGRAHGGGERFLIPDQLRGFYISMADDALLIYESLDPSDTAGPQYCLCRNRLPRKLHLPESGALEDQPGVLAFISAFVDRYASMRYGKLGQEAAKYPF